MPKHRPTKCVISPEVLATYVSSEEVDPPTKTTDEDRAKKARLRRNEEGDAKKKAADAVREHYDRINRNIDIEFGSR